MHGTLLALARQFNGQLPKQFLLGNQAGGKAARVGALWIFVAQHLARSAMDEVKPGVRRTIDALVLVFGRIIAILQPVLDPLVGGSGGAMNFDKRSFGLALLWFAALAVATVVLYAVVHH